MDKPSIVIIGASGGIGRYLMTSLLDYEVIGSYHSTNLYQSDWIEVYKERTGGRVPLLYQVDITDSCSLDNFAYHVITDHVVLINAAGVNINGSAHRYEEDWWDEVIDTNLKGTFLACKAFLPRMREKKWGRIINLSSIVGQLGVKGTVAYSASKMGLLGLTKNLAVENAHLGITVNALALGYFTVGMIDEVPHAMQEQMKKAIPVHKFGHPSNIDAAIRFLIEADYVTGATININGGLL